MEIIPGLRILPSELSFSFSRSSGPGGQNVNKVNTRVTLSFDVSASQGLNDRQRQLIFSRLATRINKLGILLISADTCRTQQGNRDETLRRFVHLLRQAVHEQRPRRKSNVSRRAKERRLSAKKNRGRLKKLRSKKISRTD
jgi:ribosome-associated protein